MKEFLDKIQGSYSKQNAWKSVLENLTLFPAFKVESGFILCLNDLGKLHLVLPEVIHKGERIMGIMIKNTHKILGHLGFQKTLEYIQKYYWWCKHLNSELGAQTALHLSVSKGVIQRKEESWSSATNNANNNFRPSLLALVVWYGMKSIYFYEGG